MIRIQYDVDGEQSAIVYINGNMVSICGFDYSTVPVYGGVCIPLSIGDVLTTRNAGYYDIKIYGIA